jgi:xanthine dehydrogenase small subunit
LTAFLLNNNVIRTSMPTGMVMVDFIRYHQHLTGTKIGCREGDCGACTILVGELANDRIKYKSVTSCLMPLANAAGKHIVTIEGINLQQPNAVQQAMCDEGATQCGFCTPGIVMSLAGFCLHNNDGAAPKNAIAAVDGNICRCTGYKSIERAAARIESLINENDHTNKVPFLISKSVLPDYFSGIVTRLRQMRLAPEQAATENHSEGNIPVNRRLFLAGGTDLYVQQPEALLHKTNNFLFDRAELKGIWQEDDKCIIGASATVSDLLDSPLMQAYFPEINRFIRLVSSTPIRNMATIAGNFINASPIGDLSIFFLALNAQLVLGDDHSTRQLALQDLYQGYKALAKSPGEYIKQIWFSLPGKNTLFNFEKVSKRTHLDIASVNTALQLTVHEDTILHARLSAGGVAPVPLFLADTSVFLKGKLLCINTIKQAIEHALAEVSPISDIRGTATYKRLLLKQLVKAHFISMFPPLQTSELLYA